jgi:hypothetical protein
VRFGRPQRALAPRAFRVRDKPPFSCVTRNVKAAGLPRYVTLARKFALTAVAVVTVGCSLAAEPSVPMTFTPTPSDVRPRSSIAGSPGVSASTLPPSPAPTQSQSPTETPSPIPTLAVSLAPFEQLTRSDAFWERWVAFLAPQTLDYVYKSLDDIVAGSDVIVRGRIAEVYMGEMWAYNDVEPLVPLIYARVAISDVLKGEPLSRMTGTVEVLLGPGVEEGVLDRPLPTEEAIWFLKSRAKEGELLGRPQASSEIAPYSYFRPNTYQAVIRNIGDESRPMFPDMVKQSYGNHEFPVGLVGQPFETLVQDVRESVASGL